MQRLIIAAAALAVSCFVLSAQPPTDLIPPGGRKIAADFTLTDSKAAAIKLSDYRGKVVLLDFWATWCDGCKTEIPWYTEFFDRYKDRGLAAIGVALDEDGWKSVKPFLEEHKINYPIIVGSWDMSKTFGFDSMPATLLIDHEGRVADLHVGMIDKAAFEREIQMLLKEAPNKPAS